MVAPAAAGKVSAGNKVRFGAMNYIAGRGSIFARKKKGTGPANGCVCPTADTDISREHAPRVAYRCARALASNVSAPTLV